MEHMLISTKPKYTIGDKVLFLNQRSTVADWKEVDGRHLYYVQTGPRKLPMWLPEEQLGDGLPDSPPPLLYHRRVPHLTIIDNFYKDPDWVRSIALEQDFVADSRSYQGKRTKERFLWPTVCEEFERVLGDPIMDWMEQPSNGCFQITGSEDPLVWRGDKQNYAGAVYLTPHAPIDSGTSFWQDRRFLARRSPFHRLEAENFPNNVARARANELIDDEHNFVNPDNWELVDRVGAVYNRLVLWDAHLFHLATAHGALDSDDPNKAMLVQLFFFTVGLTSLD